MRTVILGLDAFDPVLFEKLSDQGQLPNLTRYAEAGGYAHFEVSNPPQSEVSWTSIATGLNPGGHGIFDFVHRDPGTYGLKVSLLPTRQGFSGTQFVPPYSAHTIFDRAIERGFPATALWWPAMFPVRPESPVCVLPGLGTPDILGRLGVGTLFVTDVELAAGKRKTTAALLEPNGRDRYSGILEGPIREGRGGTHQSVLQVKLELIDDHSACLAVGKQTVELAVGMWTPILELSFKVGRFLSVRALTRAILTQVKPDVQLYLMPLQIHPLHSMWRYASPRAFVRQTWKACGPFLTLGMPQDTTALEDGCITDEQFLSLCESILCARECVFWHHLDRFREGVLASVFDSLDRIQHVFLRDRPDIVEQWYTRLDGLVGKVQEHLASSGQDQAKIVVVSDHGFTRFDHKVHLNRWLIENGYLVPKPDAVSANLQEVDWAQSRAYAVGLNSLYVNLAGREGRGGVQSEQYNHLVESLRSNLSAWRGPDGRQVVARTWRQAEVFVGPFAERGPDIVVGYSPGYRASAQTGLGKWQEKSLEVNRDRWSADHCVDPRAVPGVLFCNQVLSGYSTPSYRNIPRLTVDADPWEGDDESLPPAKDQKEDERVVEERLKGLGYL